MKTASQAQLQAFLFIWKGLFLGPPSLSCIRICLKILAHLFLSPLPKSTSCEKGQQDQREKQTKAEKSKPLSSAVGRTMVNLGVPWWDGLSCDTCGHQALLGLPLVSYFKPSGLRFCQVKGNSSSLLGGLVRRGLREAVQHRTTLRRVASAPPPGPAFLEPLHLPSLVSHPQHIQ